MNEFRNRVFDLVKGTSFWGRMFSFGILTITFMISVRFSSLDHAWIVVGMIVLAFIPLSLIWLFVGAFRRESPGTRWRIPQSRAIRIPLAICLTPIIAASSLGIGAAFSYGIVPLTSEEVAERKAFEAEQQKRDAERAKAELAKKEAEAAKQASKVAEDEQKRLEQERANANNEAQRKAEEKLAAAEKAASDRISELDSLKEKDPLLYASEICRDMASSLGYSSSKYILVDQTGTSLFLSTQESEDSLGLIMFGCVSNALEFSAPLIASIENTNALAGTKEWQEKSMNLEWSYNPSSGLSLSILREKNCFLWICG